MDVGLQRTPKDGYFRENVLEKLTVTVLKKLGHLVYFLCRSKAVTLVGTLILFI